MKTNELIRKNIRMSETVANWYEEKAVELGVSQTNLMVMALADYIKQDKAVNMMSNFEYVMVELDKLKAEAKKS